MLEDILKSKKGFKLVCGAGNEDASEVEKLVTIYSSAGCSFFDVCAKKEIVLAAKNGIKNSGLTKDRYICVSVGLQGDPHITKAYIDESLCVKCGACVSTCPRDAIDLTKNDLVIRERCIGCSKCTVSCPVGAIQMKSQLQNYDEVLPPLIDLGIDCIEFHAISTDEIDVDEKWNLLNKIYKGLLCISIDRSELGDKKLLERVKRLLDSRKPYTTIIQADGVAMSGTNDEFGTTLQAVATTQLFQNAKIPAYIMMSGGTNTKSSELAKLCGVHPDCIAVGSYARKIVKKYLEIEDLLDNSKKLNEAIDVARNFINTVLQNMGAI